MKLAEKTGKTYQFEAGRSFPVDKCGEILNSGTVQGISFAVPAPWRCSSAG